MTAAQRTFAVIGTPRQAGEQVRARFGGLVDRLQIGVNGDEADFAELFDVLRADVAV